MKHSKHTTLIAGAGLLVSLLTGSAGAQIVDNSVDDAGVAARAGVGNALTNHAQGILRATPQSAQDLSGDLQSNLRQAYQDYTEKKYERAASELQSIEKRAPGLVEAHQMLAAIYQSQNKISYMVPELEYVVSLSPKDTGAQTNLGVAYMQTGSFEKAVGVFQPLQAHSPKDSKVAYYLGLALAQAGRLDEAVPALQNAIKIQPSAPEYLELGVALQQQNKPEEAATAFQSAAALDPKDPQAPLYAGQLFHQTGHDDQAIPDLKKALDLGTANKYAVHMILAEAYDKQGKKDDALQEYTLASAAKPDDFNAVAEIGLLNQVANKKADAETAYRKALTLKASTPESTAQVQANLAILLASDNPDAAVALLTQATQGDPKNAQYQSDLGQVYEKQGKKDLALAAYQKALTLDATQSVAKAGVTRLGK